MVNKIMVCSFFLVFSAFSFTKKSVSTYAWIPVFPTSVLPEKERRSYDLEHSLVVSLHTERRSREKVITTRTGESQSTS